uniref:Putative antitoxin of YafQ-DinJ toxin-antitoxin motif, interferase, TOXIN-ANTITOXIN complex n=1 Tax=Siphoviridae sp. ctnNB1 TaxID=2825660 RepID=A0A8S5UV86_9CAUD|nr:MAG TPA: putative antitoxin of YafQ-DinJ toxin-antitoxin motif, interferase, TOXIN-ANTITOXIN complex [Siphoviridae sp. ctnNB1]
MAISIRLNKAEDELIRGYAEMHGLSVSEFMRKSALEKIEEELDLKLFEEAFEDFKKNPKTYTLDEVEKELGVR